jgi:hypothetical protein
MTACVCGLIGPMRKSSALSIDPAQRVGIRPL